MFERFADEARRATALASEEARALGHDFIGTEHLLLGLLAADGTACALLNELEVTLDDARGKVGERVHGFGGGSVESPPFTPLAKKALERANRETLQLGANLIGPEHLLLGLIDVPDGGGARILVELSGNLDQVRQAVLARIGPGPPVGPAAPLRAPVGSGPLRRWAQGRTVFAGRPGAPPPGPAPRCPGCQSPLATDARYRRLDVPPEAAEEESGEPEPTGPERPEPVTVTLVYCGHCGVVLGIV